jgi:uncharacterized protein (DUF305 family)
MRRNLVLFNLDLLLLITASSASAQVTPVPRSADEVCAQIVGGGTPVPTATADSEVDLAGLDFDLIFLDAMIPHVQNAIDMAIVANERSTRSEIEDFTAQELPLQQAQVDAMRLWREEWYPDTPALTQSQLVQAMNMKLADSPGVGGVAGLEEMDATRRDADLAELCSSGSQDVDLTYIDSVIAHNGSSIILARAAADRSTHREIRELSDVMISMQQYEIDQLLAWRDAWYQGTPIPDHHSDA